MRQLPLNAPVLRQSAAPAKANTKAAARGEQPKALRELDSDELRQVGGGGTTAPKKRW